MEAHPFIQTFWSVLPPLIAIVLAIVTRKVLLSLGLGIVLAALLLQQFNPLTSLSHLSSKVFSLFWSEGALNEWNVNILLFLLLLGCIISMLSKAGATHAFAEWAQARIKSRRQAKAMTGLLVFVFFIDDYFHSLSVGTICRPVTDRFGISRAKLAYLLDSTAAPICVLMPVSSWGAYIIALIGGILAGYGITGQSPLAAFITMGAMNFYAIFTLLMVILVIRGGWDLGLMQQHESRALQGELFDKSKGTPPGVHDHEVAGGRVTDLLFAIGGLTLVTVAGLLWTGTQALNEAGESFSLLGALENTNVGRSLVAGGVAGLLICAGALIRERTSAAGWAHTIMVGLKGMLPAIYILLFAWTIAGLISELETGKYLASLVQQSLPLYLLPAILFVLAGVMAFATGTSWGTFGVMLPIAADMTMAIDPQMLLPGMAAVMAGAVFGDHCSPISDTTILSSTGASCHHIDHVMTQLPYALSMALVSIAGFLALGITTSLLTGLLVSAITFAAVLGFWSLFRR
ncbi:Na+/H+ antiporter NhaC family protein [Oceanimonas baumannii]|uniref:Na+/H+ antiporter n=1 Tax=Oceanimonas baumannii TaxID=129578 RepID=A0A235CLH5_9GAMM|nr:Na+/H+ antiporter NhaC family protein [Oceanimonas baumannii]OYD25214.1 Na+/H+ antiporter [Oceanimonas baumannii]TDW62493.1 Na+/H+ antiporter NhaC [Oceanimonas baumannii]